ncbi:unnamed protein product [Protopolystoma xenopodis]|uniref:Uncharacterized protein n=1 Tax=Protopolystoma xenopodis TaxID=117903 RepID=A0A3S5CPX5_9PLAT|nr:unnamed protein product [Protopolystoma xenopodis]
MPKQKSSLTNMYTSVQHLQDDPSFQLVPTSNSFRGVGCDRAVIVSAFAGEWARCLPEINATPSEVCCRRVLQSSRLVLA